MQLFDSGIFRPHADEFSDEVVELLVGELVGGVVLIRRDAWRSRGLGGGAALKDVGARSGVRGLGVGGALRGWPTGCSRVLLKIVVAEGPAALHLDAVGGKTELARGAGRVVVASCGKVVGGLVGVGAVLQDSGALGGVRGLKLP